MSNTPSYRKIFPSYDWDEDVDRVNQIMNLPIVMGKEEVRFVKAVPNEEVKNDPIKIRKWIRENMEGCSCLILFVGEKTYTSEYVKYELELAEKRGVGRFIINLDGMLDLDKVPSKGGKDPYRSHGLYSDGGGYTIKPYTWKKEPSPQYLIGDWIEDACKRAGR